MWQQSHGSKIEPNETILNQDHIISSDPIHSEDIIPNCKRLIKRSSLIVRDCPQ